MNTFSERYDHSQDENLITLALSGDKRALEQLLKKHQDYVYNISLRLFANVDDALDATQEVLIKVVTRLKTFQGNSQFRTWLYRIAVNHFLNSPKSKIEVQLQENMMRFAGFTENEEPAVSEQEIEEVRVLCSMAMLQCLDREQRLVYIIGEIFGADHHIGADLFETTPENYRVKLTRARKDLLNFVSKKCGIVNPTNPCRCPKKTRHMISKGWVDRQNLLFNANFTQRVKDLIDNKVDEVSDEIKELHELFKDSPFHVKSELDNLLQSL